VILSLLDFFPCTAEWDLEADCDELKMFLLLLHLLWAVEAAHSMNDAVRKDEFFILFLQNRVPSAITSYGLRRCLLR